jgi:hypothetical protein
VATEPFAVRTLKQFHDFHKKIQNLWHVFSTRKATINPPRFTTQFTTTSPQKTIVKHALFLKHPSKTPTKQQSPGEDTLSPGPNFFLVKRSA